MPRYVVDHHDFSIPPNLAFPNGHVAKRPVLALTLTASNRQYRCHAIVNSAADHCLFPLNFARKLGLDLPAMPVANSGGIGTPGIPTAHAFVTIDLQGILQFDIYAGFTAGMDLWGVGLLGQRGFFDRFDVTFRQREGVFILEF